MKPETPCTNCNSYWSAGRNCDCTSCCDKLANYELELKRYEIKQEIKLEQEKYLKGSEKAQRRFEQIFETTLDKNREQMIFANAYYYGWKSMKEELKPFKCAECKYKVEVNGKSPVCYKTSYLILNINEVHNNCPYK
jgi:hypothetical protein